MMNPYIEEKRMYPSNQHLHHEYRLSPEDAYFQRERFNHKHDAIERAILLVGSVVTSLLGMRFALALLGANPLNGLATFVNGVTAPFVAPFTGLFSYDHVAVGGVSFQGYTLVAMLVYSLLAGLAARLATITRY
jgi:ABC-type uncharacterized transport system permease subunit